MEKEISQVARRVRPPRRKLTLDEIGRLIALLAVLLGAFLYLYPPYLAGFPINDGGLFYTMIRAIQANGLQMPAYVHYNGLNIPFAYPPLGFYVGAALSSLLHLDPLRIVQWLPGIVLIPVSIGVYLLGLHVLKSPMKAGIATFLYVCTPRSMTWLVMGGGLTRSFGQLFLVLTLTSVYALYTERRRKHLVLAIVFASLTVLSHPEAAVHTAALCILFWLFQGRSKRSFLDSILVAIGVAVITSVWWLPALHEYGLQPFLSAGQTGLNAPILLIYPLLMSFTEEPMMTLIAALGLIGLMACLARREYLLPAWVLLPFFVEPRGAQTVAVVPLSLMAAIALHEVILPALAGIQARHKDGRPATYADSGIVKFMAVYLAFFLLQLGTFAASELATVRLSESNQAAFRWVAANTPSGSRFLILTGQIELFCDPIQEWFPALTRQVSLSTVQGREWSPVGGFFAREAQLQRVQGCLQSDSPVQCLQSTTAPMQLQYDYLYVSQAATTIRFCRPTGEERRGTALALQVRSSSAFTEVYSSDDVLVLAANR